MSNKDLIDFCSEILSRYNATPDEWDEFESIKYSMETTHRISLVYFPKTKNVECEFENIATGKVAGISFPVSNKKGNLLAEIVMPCVSQGASIKKE